MALQEFRSNKLRTFLSLLGITFGIFCIISVLATISSMKTAVQNDIKSLGQIRFSSINGNTLTTIHYPWWRYYKRPTPKYEELKQLRDRVSIIQNATFMTQTQSVFEYGSDHAEWN